MTDVTFLTKPEVTLVDSMGGDYSIVQAARVSVAGGNEVSKSLDARDAGLINYLMRSKHGSPFEHNSMTFMLKVPMFVHNQMIRHRVGTSFNVMSGRYTELLPEFFIPHESRPLINVGTPSKPEMGPATPEQIQDTKTILEYSAQASWEFYQSLLDLGIANEIARSVLPMMVATQLYMTVNARSLMNFLSLRVQDEQAAHVSRPQAEIQQVAVEMETIFAELFPETHRRFIEHGRVAP